MEEGGLGRRERKGASFLSLLLSHPTFIFRSSLLPEKLPSWIQKNPPQNKQKKQNLQNKLKLDEGLARGLVWKHWQIKQEKQTTIILRKNNQIFFIGHHFFLKK